MFDPSTIGAALGSVKVILEIAKGATDLNVGLKINTEVANLQGRLIEAQQQALELQQENDRLRTEIEKSRNYVQRHSAIWKCRPDGTEDGPFCPACVGEGREMRLVLWDRADQSRAYWLTHCPRTHVDPRVKPQGFMPAPQEQTYPIPKDLVPENYFCHRTAGSF